MPGMHRLTTTEDYSKIKLNKIVVFGEQGGL